MRSALPDTSASYAAEVARLLWPEPWEAPYVTRGPHVRTSAHRDSYLFPSERHPRLMVPADVPGSSCMLQRLGNGRSPLLGPARSMLERSVRSRAFSLVRWPMLRVPGTDPSADSIERHLGECFGTQVRVGVLLGTRRANQKPVLQVFDSEGGLKGYAKVGHNELTAALVRREAESLAAVGDRGPVAFRVPQLLHHGQWAGLEVLVISALPTNPRHNVSRAARTAAMREVANLAGTTSSPLVGSTFWARLRGSDAMVSEQLEGSCLRAAAREIEQHHGTKLVRLGGWHGDWGHWNMGMGDGVLQLWDWERYESEVPVGFDGLHFAAQSVRPGRSDERRQEESFLRSLPATLSELGVPPEQHDLTLRLYLLEIAVRYVEALQHGATPALRRRNSWVLSLMRRMAEQPHPTSSKGRP